jgi:hypothetical protein
VFNDKRYFFPSNIGFDTTRVHEALILMSLLKHFSSVKFGGLKLYDHNTNSYMKKVAEFGVWNLIIQDVRIKRP